MVVYTVSENVSTESCQPGVEICKCRRRTRHRLRSIIQGRRVNTTPKSGLLREQVERLREERGLRCRADADSRSVSLGRALRRGAYDTQRPKGNRQPQSTGHVPGGSHRVGPELSRRLPRTARFSPCPGMKLRQALLAIGFCPNKREHRRGGHGPSVDPP
jgi:hypothetical protein